ncbi:hypothetical protein [Streptomyces sp. B29(2018)]|uniref:hypothetical protein n=1 Tax=Streptomyces sp. B29(2018) TaxID=2485016 RepID=UPI000FD67689|nr:hypothetical protein [Streptomyces sp. B29(2018)]
MRASSWRRTVTTVADGTGPDALPGAWLHAGEDVALPPGTLLLTADKNATGTARSRTGLRYTTEDAHVGIHLVGADGSLTTLWEHQYATSASALGRQTANRARALLGAHPAPGAAPVVLAEAQRPNRRRETCIRCVQGIAPGGGHLLGHGRDTAAEHWPSCQEAPTGPLPLPAPRRGCDNCGGRGRGHAAVDSSGIPGSVCTACSREPAEELSFA